jgi:hypothetical protein
VAEPPPLIYTPGMPCDHLGPPEIIELTERYLRDRNISEAEWPGRLVRHGENTEGGMWASVVIELERRGDDWVVTRLDRRREALAQAETGLRVT